MEMCWALRFGSYCQCLSRAPLQAWIFENFLAFFLFFFCINFSTTKFFQSILVLVHTGTKFIVLISLNFGTGTYWYQIY
jgi:hypothetical protein